MFKGRQFDGSVILLCAWWYPVYNLDLRNVRKLMTERGIVVDHATIHKRTIRYFPKSQTLSAGSWGRPRRPLMPLWPLAGSSKED